MQRPICCIVGLLIAAVAILCRLGVGDSFTSLSLTANTIQISRDYQWMLAWIDILNIAIVAGLALGAIGWLVPVKRG